MLGIARTFLALCKTHTYLEQRTIRTFFVVIILGAGALSRRRSGSHSRRYRIRNVRLNASLLRRLKKRAVPKRFHPYDISPAKLKALHTSYPMLKAMTYLEQGPQSERMAVCSTCEAVRNESSTGLAPGDSPSDASTLLLPDSRQASGQDPGRYLTFSPVFT